MTGSAAKCSKRNVLQLAELTMEGIMPRPGQQAGHVIYNACYQEKKLIYKINKPGKVELTLLEKLFSVIAKLSLSAHLTPEHYLVKDGEKITGLAVENLQHTIARREGTSARYYELKREILPNLEFKEVPSKEIPVYFFDGLPSDCFKTLFAKDKEGLIRIDRSSLASVFATAYTFEEDDLHRANWGVYFCDDNGIPKAVFFKIDHDLLFVASIKAFVQRRLFHLFDSNTAFNIDVRSLERLPNISSHNDYWPTKRSYLPRIFDKKGYHSFAEASAFSDLEKDTVFEKEKWLAFYKQILLPNKLIHEKLMQVGEEMQDSTEEVDSVVREKVILVYQATITRLSHLRATLLASEKFRHFVSTLSDEEKTSLVREIVSEGPYLEEIRESMAKIEHLCDQDCRNDTPLHFAIKLNMYRFEETLAMFGQFLHVKNHQDQSPLEVAIHLYQQESDEDARANLGCVIHHLLKNGATTKAVIPKIIRFENPYLKHLEASTTYKDLKKELIQLSEDCRFSLKFRKKLTIDCVKEWLNVRKGHKDFKKDLEQFKREMNGHCTAEAAAGLKFIRQLRSRLWIIRQIRGLYGRTTTQITLNQMLNKALKDISPIAFSFSFFGGAQIFPDAHRQDIIVPSV